MKKIGFIFMLFVIGIILTGCSVNYTSIEKSFEEAGYTYSETSSYVAILLTEFESKEMNVDVWSFTNGDDALAVVISFEDEDDIESAFNSNPFLKGFIDEGYEVDNLKRDNYVVLPITVSNTRAEEIINVFQGN